MVRQKHVGWRIADTLAIVTAATAFALASSAAQAADAMFINDLGDVGVGTSTPSASLHVVRSDNSAQVLVVDNAIPANPNFPEIMFKLERPGSARFDIVDSNLGVSWVFASQLGNFVISKAGTGIQEFKMEQNGNLTITGSYFSGSSRDIKDNIALTDGEDVLARLDGLPIAEWTYKADSPDVRHIGPMAEDFAASFGLGVDDKHIAPGDVAGVALAAAQALSRENRELQQRNQQLERRLEALEQRLAQLARSVGPLAVVATND